MNETSLGATRKKNKKKTKTKKTKGNKTDEDTKANGEGTWNSLKVFIGEDYGLYYQMYRKRESEYMTYKRALRDSHAG